jgi:hypothetical protein
MTIGIVFEIAYVEASLPALERGLIWVHARTAIG